MNRLLGTFAATFALTGCFGFTPYEPQYAPPPNEPAPAASATAKPQAPSIDCGIAEVVPPSGDLAKDLLGTWQDWGGSVGVVASDKATDKVTDFQADGTVIVSSYPLTKQGWADRTQPRTVDFTGKYELLLDARLSIVWDDGLTEITPGSVSLDPDPRCRMLVIEPGPGSRIPGQGELERVTCTAPAASAALVR